MRRELESNLRSADFESTVLTWDYASYQFKLIKMELECFYVSKFMDKTVNWYLDYVLLYKIFDILLFILQFTFSYIFIRCSRRYLRNVASLTCHIFITNLEPTFLVVCYTDYSTVPTDYCGRFASIVFALKAPCFANRICWSNLIGDS